MAERPSVLELERALTDLGRHVEYPPTPDLAARVRQELAARPAPAAPSFWADWLPLQRRLALALVALIAVVGAVLAISPEARTAVADRLGLRSVVIREVPALPTLHPTAGPTPATPSAAGPTVGSAATPPGVTASPLVPTVAPAAMSPGQRLALGRSLTLDQARALVSFQIPVPASLGPPDEVYLLDPPAGGQVSLVYYPRPGLPQARTTGLGLLLTVFPGSVPDGMFGKGVPPGTRLEEVQVNGGHGYWIEGAPHTLYVMDTRGQVRTETTRLAGNVLLWDQGPLTLRIESVLSKDEVLKIAASVP